MFIIGVVGISCSGKSRFSKILMEKLGEENCLIISMDDYYNELTKEQYEVLYNDDSNINFDTPDAINLVKMYETIVSISNGVDISIPQFDTGSCVVSRYLEVPGNKYKYLIIEGVMIFCKEEIKNICNLKIWIETSEYICALRRFIKYTEEIKGYTPQYIYNQSVKFVIPGQEKYVKPHKSDCDIFINGDKFEVNLEMVLNYILNRKKLN
jgi:uridine kinase